MKQNAVNSLPLQAGFILSWKVQMFLIKAIQLSHSCSLILLYLTLRNLSPIPYFTTSLIQPCKILTAIRSLFTIHPPSSGVPIFISNLPLLFIFSLHLTSSSLFSPHSSYLTCFCGSSQNTDILNEVSINPRLPANLHRQLADGRQWSDQIAQTLCTFTCSGGAKIRRAGNRKWIYLSFAAPTQTQTCRENAQMHPHTNTRTAAAASVFTWKERQMQKELGGGWMLISLWERDRRG